MRDLKSRRLFLIGSILLVFAIAMWAGLGAQSGAQTKNPGKWPYADSMDAPVAAGNIHHVRYEDDHVRFIEVAYFPGVKGKMHGHPWPSVSMQDAVSPNAQDTVQDPKSPLNQAGPKAPPPASLQWPTCSTRGPQAPHAVTNNDTFPLHFFRLEYKRIDSENDPVANWEKWYPWVKKFGKVPQPPLMGKITKNPGVFPYDDGYDAPYAAPNVHHVRFEDDHVRLVEVAYAPGLQGNMHGHPWPSVFARDLEGVEAPNIPNLPPAGLPSRLDPTGALDQLGTGEAGAPPGLRGPTCGTMASQAPHAPYNRRVIPNHFLRLEYKRIDGEGIKTNWQKWYPWMVKLQQEQTQ